MGSAAGKITTDDSSSSSSSSNSYARRRAHHAGSWYEEDGDALRQTLQGYLGQVEAPGDAAYSGRRLRAVIVPHAGYSYSGPTAAYSYHAVLAELRKADSPVTKILVLHPSHHVSAPGTCAVSNAAELETPVGNLRVDAELRRKILKHLTGITTFTVMTATQDEHEHSGEMQYPYLAHCLNLAGKIDSVTVTPVMCGSLKITDEIAAGELLSEIISRPEVLTVVSTDFCHWGRRFSYQPVDRNSNVPIHEFIEQLDRRGMDTIAAQQPGAFAEYLKETRNTVCGRHAVAVWLRAVTAAASKQNGNDDKLMIQFAKYAQSSPSKTMSDSSVSYAAALATIDTASSNNHELRN